MKYFRNITEIIQIMFIQFFETIMKTFMKYFGNVHAMLREILLPNISVTFQLNIAWTISEILQK